MQVDQYTRTCVALATSKTFARLLVLALHLQITSVKCRIIISNLENSREVTEFSERTPYRASIAKTRILVDHNELSCVARIASRVIRCSCGNEIHSYNFIATAEVAGLRFNVTTWSIIRPAQMRYWESSPCTVIILRAASCQTPKEFPIKPFSSFYSLIFGTHVRVSRV